MQGGEKMNSITLDDLMEKIDESMTMTRKQQKDLDKMEKAMMNE